MFVFNAVSSISLPLVDLAEFTSMLTNASVESITIFPPDGKLMFLYIRSGLASQFYVY